MLDHRVSINNVDCDIILEEGSIGSRLKLIVKDSTGKSVTTLVTLVDDDDDYYIRMFGKSHKGSWDMGKLHGPFDKDEAIELLKNKFDGYKKMLDNNVIPKEW